MFKKITIFLYAVVATVYVIFSLDPFDPSKSVARLETVNLSRGPFVLLDFPSKKSETAAIILFNSGDNGWGYLEEAIARGAQKKGYELIGVNMREYAAKDYDLSILQADFAQIAETARARFAGHEPPIVLSGYSMGAAQAIAEAGGPHPPPGLAGLLLIDPLSRGRYGLRLSDAMNLQPTGAGTFAMSDFSKTMTNLRVVQWHAAYDIIDSSAWLQSLTVPYKEITRPNEIHTYSNNREEFVQEFIDCIDWILHGNQEKLPQGKP